MIKGAPKTRDLAERLIAYESRRKASPQKAPALIMVCEKLRPALATLMGKAGFRALLLRALALGSEEVIWLRVLHVKLDGSLEGLEDVLPPNEAARATEGGIVLISHLLDLLVAFIGENLTLGLVREVWPKLSVKDLDLGGGGNK